jgi:ribosomal protein S18 acetylase RimI-like enzyme
LSTEDRSGRRDHADGVDSATVTLAWPLTLTVRELQAEDLADLDWSGGQRHVDAIAARLQASFAGDSALVVAALPNDRLVATGVADFTTDPAYGLIMMLAVHEMVQSLGLGSIVIEALEQRIRARGLAQARIDVEHDNPRAAALYRRLGYREAGTVLDSWSVADGRSYVTICTVMKKSL